MSEYTPYQLWFLLRSLRDMIEQGRSDVALREIERRMRELPFSEDVLR